MPAKKKGFNRASLVGVLGGSFVTTEEGAARNRLLPDHPFNQPDADATLDDSRLGSDQLPVAPVVATPTRLPH